MYDVASVGAQAYMAVARELLDRGERTAIPTRVRRRPRNAAPPKRRQPAWQSAGTAAPTRARTRRASGTRTRFGPAQPPRPQPPSQLKPLRPNKHRKRAYARLPISQIRANPYQPRQEFRPEDLADLEASLRANGLLQPITVRPAPNGSGFELIAGERRFRAATRLGWTEIPAIVRETDDRTLLTLAMVENLQRADLDPIEEADGYHRLMEEFDLSQQEVADVVGKDRSTVANALRLRQLPAAVRRLLQEKQMSAGHARALLAADNRARDHRPGPGDRRPRLFGARSRTAGAGRARRNRHHRPKAATAAAPAAEACNRRSASHRRAAAKETANRRVRFTHRRGIAARSASRSSPTTTSSECSNVLGVKLDS